MNCVIEFAFFKAVVKVLFENQRPAITCLLHKSAFYGV